MRWTLLLVPLLTLSCQPGPPRTAPPHLANCRQVELITPTDGQILPSQNLVTIDAELTPPGRKLGPVNAKVVAIRGTEEILVAQGDIRSFSKPDILRALWDITNVPPGEYTLRVEVAGYLPDEARVTVHRAPSVDLKVVSSEPGQNRTVNVVLEAAAVSPSGTASIDYVWSAGDGSPSEVTRSARFSHSYGAGRTYIVWVEVHDALGGATLIARDLDVPIEIQDPPKAQETHDCGCKTMTITAGGGASRTYCVPTVAGGVHPAVLAQLVAFGCAGIGAAGAGGCPAGHVPFTCPLGQRNPQVISWGFEVQAQLTEKTNDQTVCTEGQYARGTATTNGFPLINPQVVGPPPPTGAQNLPDGAAGGAGFGFNVVGAGNPYPPAAGPDYGPDDFAVPGTYKRHVADSFYWYDPPSSGFTPGATSLGQRKEFIAFVRGTPTCWCRFTLKQDWTQAGGLAAGNEIEILDGQNCVKGAGVVDRR